MPLMVTVPLSVEMYRSSASILAFRLNAFLIECCTSPAAGVGRFNSMSLKTSSVADDARRDEVGLVALVLPVDGAGQGDEAVLDLRVDRRRDEAVEHQRLQHVAAKIRVVAPLADQQPTCSSLST